MMQRICNSSGKYGICFLASPRRLNEDNQDDHQRQTFHSWLYMSKNMVKVTRCKLSLDEGET